MKLIKPVVLWVMLSVAAVSAAEEVSEPDLEALETDLRALIERLVERGELTLSEAQKIVAAADEAAAGGDPPPAATNTESPEVDAEVAGDDAPLSGDSGPTADEAAAGGDPPAGRTPAATNTESPEVDGEVAGEDAPLSGDSGPMSDEAAPEAIDPTITNRVTYVPEIVRERIREEVKQDLKAEVVAEVKAEAQREGWGVPAGLPPWLRRIEWSGDIRLRGEGVVFDDTNDPALDFQAINEAGSIAAAGQDAFHNTSENRYRLRVRARLGLKAELAEGLEAGLRLSTGSTDNPVSNNQTLGDFFQDSDLVLDRAYLRYRTAGKGLTVSGGRMANPFFHTDLVWDSDVDFPGLAATVNPWGTTFEESRLRPFATIGAFPLDEVALSDDDKWLFGAQLGSEWDAGRYSRFTLGVAYYDFYNVTGVANPDGSEVNDFTAPDFVQNGNTKFDIATGAGAGRDLFAYASDFDEINATLAWRYSLFDPIHITVTGDYVRNLGFDKDEVAKRAGGDVQEEVDGYQLGITVGNATASERGLWQIWGAYRHLEADAVLDAFADSDFHLGGTNAEGWIVGAALGVYHNTWLELEWMSSTEAEAEDAAADIALDRILIDLKARF